MPSSTSSSDSESRRVALRTAVAGVAVLLGGLLLIRGCNAAAEHYLPDPFGIVRIKTARQALPEIAEAPGPKTLFLGSSLVDLGFGPMAFDAELAASGVEMTSYNLGIGNMNPALQLVLARRMREAFESRGARVDLMLVEFNPFQTTRKRVRANAPFREAVLAVLGTPRTLWRDTLEDAERGARLFTIWYLRDGVAAEAVTTGLGLAVGGIASAFEEEPPELADPEFERVLDERRTLAFELYPRLLRELPDWRPPLGWSFARRGTHFRLDQLSPESRELMLRLFENLHHPKTLQAALERRIRCCDIVDLHFDPGLVADFVALLRELQPISDRIEVVLMPKNSTWVKNPPEALDRQRAVLERIERETGVRVADFQTALPELDESFFTDATHLRVDSGQKLFSEHLARHWAARLQQDPAADPGP